MKRAIVHFISLFDNKTHKKNGRKSLNKKNWRTQSLRPPVHPGLLVLSYYLLTLRGAKLGINGEKQKAVKWKCAARAAFLKLV